MNAQSHRACSWGQALICGLFVVTATGCGDADEEPLVDEIRPGVIRFGDEPVGGDTAIMAPARASVGVAIPVTVQTSGGGCESLYSTDVSYTGQNEVVVSPFDRTYQPADGACLLRYDTFDHSVEIVFDTPGEKVLRARGRWKKSTGAEVMLELTHRIDVE